MYVVQPKLLLPHAREDVYINNLMHTCQMREDDTSLFDSKFTDQPAVDSPVECKISASADLNFSGFTYVAPSVLEDLYETEGHRVSVEEGSRRSR